MCAKFHHNRMNNIFFWAYGPLTATRATCVAALLLIGYNTEFVQFLSSSIDRQSYFILVDDLNYPNINWLDFTSNVSIEEFSLDFVNYNSLHQCVLEPTRAANILVLCLSTSRDLFKTCVVHETFCISDHCYLTRADALILPKSC